ncbi:alpha/beta fold hydrolase [Pararhodobacter aggregans]|uniref:Alpha/beta hydrolase n=1 Tax=Pararhodobacter aggregans TaxID=404875 RepID=A0A2T7UUY4_9RHOB|nr:alpha/beta fold hydrolase [Pararhodobacter aggregans]PTX04060.1 putative alpha/beta hydrolase [Pararhodobacter aggregans]PVE48474.1 alpha/beta hydrolase [Pararhodobacter aggregans]
MRTAAHETRPAIAEERFEVRAADGYPIRGGIWQGDGGPVVVIHAATAVRAGYYARFAAWLAGQGATVLTFDYRGIGESRSIPLRHLPAGWVDWGVLDAEAVQAYAAGRWPDRPLSAVGHSIGGFALGLADSAARLERVVTVGAQFAYWRDFAPDQRRGMYLKWHLFMPAVTRLMGYFPGARLGWLEDVPRGVVRDWSGMGPRFEQSVLTNLDRAALARRHGSTRARLLAIGLTDDPFCTEAAAERLLGYYTGAERSHWRIAPADIAVPEIGHFAFFHNRFEGSLWPLAADWLLAGTLPPGAPGRIVTPGPRT